MGVSVEFAGLICAAGTDRGDECCQKQGCRSRLFRQLVWTVSRYRAETHGNVMINSAFHPSRVDK